MRGTNVITIQKNIPIPPIAIRGLSGRYDFVYEMEVGDSFKVNGNTPDITPKAIKCWVYNRRIKASTPELRSRKYTMRTIRGDSINPTSIRIWRIA